MIKSIFFTGLLFLVASTISAQVIKSAMINGCKTEGLNEYLIVKNGNSSFTAAASNIDIRYGTSSPASTTITDQLLTNGDTGYIAALNAKLGSGCDFNFINTTNSTTIAANAFFVIMHKYPDDTANFSAWCGKGIGDVYVVFADDASWGNAGIFANDTRSVTRYLRSTINGVTYDYNYGGLNLNSDGGYVSWNDTAGTYTGSGNYSNCTPSNLQSLPVSLLYFKAILENNKTNLQWATASEYNNEHFTIKKFNEHKQEWEILNEINASMNAQQISFYNFIDYGSQNKSELYALSQTDIDGKETHLAYASAAFTSENIAIAGQNKGKLYITTDNIYNPITITTYQLNGAIIDCKVYFPSTTIVEHQITFGEEIFILIKIEQDGHQLIKKLLKY